MKKIIKCEDIEFQIYIEDTDFAAESMKLAKARILEQVAIAMIAQANARTQWILKLLEN